MRTNDKFVGTKTNYKFMGTTLNSWERYILTLLYFSRHRHTWRCAASIAKDISSFHPVLSSADRMLLMRLLPDHFFTLSTYCIPGLPRLLFPGMVPVMHSFTSSFPCCLIECPKNASFLFTIRPSNSFLTLSSFKLQLLKRKVNL